MLASSYFFPIKASLLLLKHKLAQQFLLVHRREPVTEKGVVPRGAGHLQFLFISNEMDVHDTHAVKPIFHTLN